MQFARRFCGHTVTPRGDGDVLASRGVLSSQSQAQTAFDDGLIQKPSAQVLQLTVPGFSSSVWVVKPLGHGWMGSFIDALHAADLGFASTSSFTSLAIGGLVLPFWCGFFFTRLCKNLE